MPITHKLEDGTEQTLYTQEELAAKEQAITEKEQELEAIKAKNAELEKVSREKSDNIKKLRDMTEEEKEKFTQAELENRSYIEKLEEELAQARNYLSEKEKREIEKARINELTKYAGDNEEVKNKILSEYQMINIEEKDEDSVVARMAKAARLAGIDVGGSNYNPVNAYWEGEAPGAKAKTEEKEKDDFFKSGKGADVLKHLGDA